MAPADGFTAVAASEHVKPGLRQKVFVSYSRTNIAIADEICAGLAFDGGFEVFLDRHSIHEGEVWRERLAGLIASADTVVFLLSKASAGSELCRWEVDQALGLSKRIVPALIEQVEGAAVPPALTALQYVRFDTGSFMGGMAGLREALRADIGWVREHTRLLTRAQEWDAAGRIANRLLSGPDIAAAKLWLEQRPQDAPPPLELHRDFIAASAVAEAARAGDDRKRAQMLKDALGRSRVALAAAVAAGVVAAGVGVWAYTSGVSAENAAVTRDKVIGERDAQIKVLQAQVAALTGAAAPVSVPPAVAGPPDLSHGQGAPEPTVSPTPSGSPGVVTGTTADKPASPPVKQPTAPPKQEIEPDQQALAFEAQQLYEQVSKLSYAQMANSPVQQGPPAIPAVPDAKTASRSDLQGYVVTMRQYRDKLLMQSNSQQLNKAPEQYKRNLPKL